MSLAFGKVVAVAGLPRSCCIGLMGVLLGGTSCTSGFHLTRVVRHRTVHVTDGSGTISITGVSLMAGMIVKNTG